MVIGSKVVYSDRGIVDSNDLKSDRCTSGVFTVIVCGQEREVITSDKVCAEIVIGRECQDSAVGIEVSECTVGRSRE